MEIRRATGADAAAIADVHVRSWKGAYPGLLPQDYLDRLRPEDRQPAWEQVLSETQWPRQGVLLLTDEAVSHQAVHGDGPVRGDQPVHGDGPVRGNGPVRGFAHVCPARDDDLDSEVVAEVTSIYLAPEAWGGGNGLALMQAALGVLTDAGYSSACLWALDTNARARRFYEIGGWRTDGATKSHDWGEFLCTDVRYVRELP
jgi:GNAT superfamily N-acetyltransferase